MEAFQLPDQVWSGTIMQLATRIASWAAAGYAAAVILVGFGYPVSAMQSDLLQGCIERGRVARTTCECNAREAIKPINFLNAPLYAVGILKFANQAIIAVCS